MPSVELLKLRLDQLATSLAGTGKGLALLALGSSGRELDRLDTWSDLDFFAIVAPGARHAMLEDPSWLAAGVGLDWCFRNTVDGFKLLWADGVFAEMALFEPDELERIPFAPGRVVWAAPGFDLSRLEPRTQQGRVPAPPDEAWAREELLSCLYVGLSRFRRGEQLSAWRLIQGACVDRFVELVHLRPPAAGLADPYDRARRFEQRYPEAARLLPLFLGGYEATPAAARALLEWLERTGPVNVALRGRVRSLLER